MFMMLRGGCVKQSSLIPEGSEVDGFGCIGSSDAAGPGMLPGKCQNALIAALANLALSDSEHENLRS